MRWVAVLAALALVVGCTERPRAEIVVIVATDLAVPSALDRVEVQVDARPVQALDLASRGDVPATLALISDGAHDAPITVTVTGLVGGAPVARERAVTRFEAGEARALVVWLLDRCRLDRRACADGEACQPEGCVPEQRGPLPPASQTFAMGFDAGVGVDAALPDANLPDAGFDAALACVPIGRERCSGLDEDCDTRVDEASDNVDVEESRMASLAHPHCGRCDNACDPCVRGHCQGVREAEAAFGAACVVGGTSASAPVVTCGPEPDYDQLTRELLDLEVGPVPTATDFPLVCAIAASASRYVACVGAEFPNGSFGLCSCVSASCLECPYSMRIAGETTSAGPFLSLAVGAAHVCAVRDDGTTLCMGSNVRGQLGRSDADVFMDEARGVMNPPGPIAQVVAGGQFNCLRERDPPRRVFCFGDDDLNSLGRPSRTLTNHRANVPVEYVDEAPLEDIIDVACAGQGDDPANPFQPHCCAVRLDGEVLCWGANGMYQLDGVTTGTEGNPPTQLTRPPAMGRARDVEVGPSVSCAITADDEVWCWGTGVVLGVDDPDEHAPRRIDFPGGAPIRDMSVSAGIFDNPTGPEVFAVARAWSGEVYCWGSNFELQCTPDFVPDQLDPVAVTP